MISILFFKDVERALHKIEEIINRESEKYKPSIFAILIGLHFLDTKSILDMSIEKLEMFIPKIPFKY